MLSLESQLVTLGLYEFTPGAWDVRALYYFQTIIYFHALSILMICAVYCFIAESIFPSKHITDKVLVTEI